MTAWMSANKRAFTSSHMARRCDYGNLTRRNLMPDESPGQDQAGMPPDPVSMLAAGAAQLHELFTAYITAGFLRNEALYLTGTIITAGMRNAQPPDAPPQAS